MDSAASLAHWNEWAKAFGGELRATTKCETIKRLEIEAFARHLPTTEAAGDGLLTLEVGCGNGINGLALSSLRSDLLYVGLDFSDRMISHAAQSAQSRLSGGDPTAERLAFGVGDARSLTMPLAADGHPGFCGDALAPILPSDAVDCVITDRMLINLGSAREQLEVMRSIARSIETGGLFLMLENSGQTHENLNAVRDQLGLKPRSVAKFNVFIDEEEVIEPFKLEMDLIGIDDFSAVHDLALYAIQPALAQGGDIEYDTPLMKVLTEAVISTQRAGTAGGSPYGQNRLWIWRKP